MITHNLSLLVVVVVVVVVQHKAFGVPTSPKLMVSRPVSIVNRLQLEIPFGTAELNISNDF